MHIPQRVKQKAIAKLPFKIYPAMVMMPMNQIPLTKRKHLMTKKTIRVVNIYVAVCHDDVLRYHRQPRKRLSTMKMKKSLYCHHHNRSLSMLTIYQLPIYILTMMMFFRIRYRLNYHAVTCAHHIQSVRIYRHRVLCIYPIGLVKRGY